MKSYKNEYKPSYTKQGIQEICENKILPYFNFNKDWYFSEDGQLQLEQARYGNLMPHQYGMKQFAAKYTRNIRFFKATSYKLLFDFVDKKFFTSVLLYGCLCIIYARIKEKHGYILASEVEDQLRDFVTEALLKYLKKKGKEKYKKLSRYEKRFLEEDILHVIWSNFKELKIIKHKFRLNSNYITAHTEFDQQKYEEAFKPWLFDLPCIKPPINWELNFNNELVNGGYHLHKKRFLSQKIEFTGEVKFSDLFKQMINKLQHMEWTIDSEIYKYVEQEFESLLLKLEKNEKIKLKHNKDDIFQTLNTYLFVKRFCIVFSNFYYSYSADVRGRLYPQSHWSFAPSSSKFVRKILRLPKYENLTSEGADYLYMKIGVLCDIPYNSNLELLEATKQSLDIKKKEHESRLDYNSNMIMQILENIDNKNTNHCIQKDATCSAFQFLAIVSNNEKLMRLTNVIGENSDIAGPKTPFVRSDLYTYILNLCKTKLPHVLMNIFLKRDTMKALIMPKAYGKTPFRSIDDLCLIIDSEENIDIREAILNLSDDSITNNLPASYKKTLNEKRKESTSKYVWYKIICFNTWFYQFFDTIFNNEFPELKDFMGLWLTPHTPLSLFTFSTEFLNFTNIYNVSEFYAIKKKRDSKKSQISFFRLTEDVDYAQTAQSALANFIHGLDAFNCHNMIYTWPNNKNIGTNHDCFTISPNDATLASIKYKEGCIKIQNYVKTIPEIAKYHENGSIPIISNNMLKIS